MADSYTPNYNLIQPQDGGSNGTWGPKINANLGTIDSVMFANQVPVGSIIMFGGPQSTVPAHWVPCYGQSVDTTTYAALFAVIGYQFGGSASRHLTQ